MEQTLLESSLEETLLDLGMPLGEREYAEDLDFYAEVADWTTDVKSTDSQEAQLRSRRSGGDLTEEQFNRGRQSFLRRRSELYEGLGFEYVIFISEYVGEKRPARDIADFVIPIRNFGKSGSETLDIYYNTDFALEDSGQRYHQQLIDRFYQVSPNSYSGTVLVCPDNEIKLFSGCLDRLFDPVDDPEDSEHHIREILVRMENYFFEQYLDEGNVGLLMSYVRELKEAV